MKRLFLAISILVCCVGLYAQTKNAAYLSYIEKNLRARFGLEGAPLRIFLKGRVRKSPGSSASAAKAEDDGKSDS
jgi:predicted GTPase